MKETRVQLVLLLLSGLAAPIHSFALASPVFHQEGQSAQSPSGLTLDGVVVLVQAGISEDVILAKIRQNGKPFALSADQIFQLKDASVSDRVIRALIDPQSETGTQPSSGVASTSQTQTSQPSPSPVATPRLPPPHPDPTHGSRDMDEVVPYPTERVQEAAAQAMQVYGFQIKKGGQGYLEGTRSRHIGVFVGSGGEKVRITLTTVQKGTRVTIKTGKGFVGRLGKHNWSAPIFREMMRILTEGG